MGVPRRARGWRCWFGRASISSPWCSPCSRPGAVAILIDPGMGRRNLVRCLAEAEPEGFVAIPLVQAVRVLLAGPVSQGPLQRDGRPALVLGRPDAGTASRRAVERQRNWPPPRPTTRRPSSSPPAAPGRPRACSSRTAISTPRWSRFAISTASGRARSICPAFPLFGLFNCAMGVTAVIPDMDPSRPAQVDPAQDRRGDRRLERHPGLRLAGDLGPRRPLLPRPRRSGCRRSAACFRPGAGAGRRAAADEGLHPSGRRRSYALRRHRGACRWPRLRPAKCSARRPSRRARGRRRLRGTAISPASAGRSIRIVDGPIASLDEA